MSKLLTTLLALFCLACALPVSHACANPIRIAYLQSDLHQLPCWVALEKGLYAAEGAEVKVAGIFRAGPELMTAMASGSLDMAYVGEAPATVSFARGKTNFHVVAQVNTGGSAIVVAKESKIAQVADVKGGRIAIPGNGSVQDFLVRRALAKAGLAPRDASIIVLPPAEMSNALKRGQIDAFIAWQPFPARAVARDGARILADSADLWPGHPCCCLIATEKAIADGSAAKLAQAHVKAVAFIKEKPDEAIAIAAKYTGMDEATLKAAFARVTYQAEPVIAEEAEYVQYLADFGFIPKQDGTAFAARLIKPLIK